jgi:hypothetical protein
MVAAKALGLKAGPNPMWLVATGGLPCQQSETNDIVKEYCGAVAEVVWCGLYLYFSITYEVLGFD